MGSKSSSRSSSVKSMLPKGLLPKGMDLTQVVLLILVGCLLCTMMSSNVVEGFDLTDGANCVSIYGGLGESQCVPDGSWGNGPTVNGNPTPGDKDIAEIYCNSIAKQGGCTPDGITESNTNPNDLAASVMASDTGINLALSSIIGALDTALLGGNGVAPNEDASDLVRATAGDVAASVDFDQIECKTGGAVSQCDSAIDETTCEGGLNEGYCYWEDCTGDYRNPFLTKVFNPLDYQAIEGWKKCVEKAVNVDGTMGDEAYSSFETQLIQGIHGTAGASEGTKWAEENDGWGGPGTASGNPPSSGYVLPTNAWGQTYGLSATIGTDEGNLTDVKNARRGTADSVTSEDLRLVDVNGDGSSTINPNVWPTKWVSKLQTLVDKCKSSDDDTIGVIGWDSSGHNVKCLNYDSSKVEQCFTMERQAPYNGCGCQPGQFPDNHEKKICEKNKIPTVAEKMADTDCNYAQAIGHTAFDLGFRAASGSINTVADGTCAAARGVVNLTTGTNNQ